MRLGVARAVVHDGAMHLEGTRMRSMRVRLGSRVAVVVSVLALTGCELFGGGPGPTPDTGVPALDGGDADGAVGPPAVRRVRLLGPWQQASHDESDGSRSVARTYVVDRRAASGSGTPFTTAACAEGCSEACGLALDLPVERRIADAQVVTAPDDRVYVHLLEGPSADRVTSPDGMSSRILVASTLDDSLLGREPIVPDLAAAFEAVHGRAAPPVEDLRLVVRDMFVLGHSPTRDGGAIGADTAHALVLFGHLFDRRGSAWAVRDVFLAIDPASERLLFTASLPEEVFTQFAPGFPMYRALGAAISRDGRLFALRAGRIVTRGQVFSARIPGLSEDGSIVPEPATTHVALTPLALEDAAADEYDALGFGLDDLDRLWSFGGVAVHASACTPDAPAPDQLRVRVHGADGALLYDLPDPSRTFTAIRTLRVERRADAPATWRVLVLGDRPTAPRCLDARNQFSKSPTVFTDDEDDADACPLRFEGLCRSDPSACPCRGCDGLREECAAPIGELPGQVLVAWTFDGADASPMTLTLRNVRAFAADGVTSFATDRRGEGLLAGRGLSFLHLDDDRVEASLRWTVPEWDTTSGLFESTPLSNLDGGWQTPLFDTARGERFVAGLRSTHVVSTPGPGPLITRTASEWGNVVTGMTGSIDLLESRTIARERLDSNAGHGEVDRVFPLARGRLLHVFHWAGPPASEAGGTALVNQRRLELRLAVPQDVLEYARGRDLAVPIAFDAPRTPIC